MIFHDVNIKQTFGHGQPARLRFFAAGSGEHAAGNWGQIVRLQKFAISIRSNAMMKDFSPRVPLGLFFSAYSSKVTKPGAVPGPDLTTCQ
jgi:hypothetical protein